MSGLARQRLSGAKQWASSTRWKAHASSPSRRPVCVVYGNCQAAALRNLLDAVPEFAAKYRAVHVPGVHEIRPDQIRTLHRLISRTQLLIAHPVRDGYRELGLGTNEIASRLPDGARTLTISPLYFEGLYPFQIYLHRQGETLATPAPTTGYHDLRTLWAASRPDPAAAAVDAHARKVPREELRSFSEESAQRLSTREESVEIRTWAQIRAALDAGRDRAFYSVNHPTDGALWEIVEAVCGRLGLTCPGQPPQVQAQLATVQTPIEAHVVESLGASLPGAADWVIDGQRKSPREIVRWHLAWYAAHPVELADGLEEHRSRLERFGFA